MADLAITDLTYTINERKRVGRRYFVEATIAFGNNALTYPTGGIPLSYLQLGFRDRIDALMVLESNSNALLYEWDKSANTLCVYDHARTEHSGGVTAEAPTSLEVYAVGW